MEAPTTYEELQAAEKKAFWTETEVKSGLLKKAFRFKNVRSYRHALRDLLRGEAGLTREQQEERLTKVAELAEEAVVYSKKRDFGAHQAAKAAAREAYEATLQKYMNENPVEAFDFDNDPLV